jgi:hypothetical protein
MNTSWKAKISSTSEGISAVLVKMSAKTISQTKERREFAGSRDSGGLRRWNLQLIRQTWPVSALHNEFRQFFRAWLPLYLFQVKLPSAVRLARMNSMKQQPSSRSGDKRSLAWLSAIAQFQFQFGYDMALDPDGGSRRKVRLGEKVFWRKIDVHGFR